MWLSFLSLWSYFHTLAVWVVSALKRRAGSPLCRQCVSVINDPTGARGPAPTHQRHDQHFLLLMTVFQNLSPPFFPSQASIVTVIRLVNDAVDTIESEGTMSPLCVSPLTPLLSSQSYHCSISPNRGLCYILHCSVSDPFWTPSVHRLLQDYYFSAVVQILSG